MWTTGLMVGSAALWHALPRLTRPTVLFAVSVPEGVGGSLSSLRIIRVYRTSLWLGTAVCAALPFQGIPIGRAVLIQTATACLAWAWAHRRVLPYAAPAPRVRIASLEARSPNLPGGLVVAVGPFVILAAIALYLHFNWALIPDRIPTRWSLDGTPQSWRPRTIVAVYQPLGFAAIVAAMMLGSGWAILRRTRQTAIDAPGVVAEHRFKAVHAGYGIVSAYLLTLMAGTMALQAIVPGSLGLLFPLGLIVLMAVVMLVWSLKVGPSGQRDVWRAGVAKDAGDGTPDAAWKLGQFYVNRQDPAFIVERRMGLGWTLNFGHPLTWLFLGALIALAVLTRWLSH
jgi:uncharacterized membrane protein